MLEQVNWLDQIPDTTDNVEALKVIFREGMRYCTTFMNGVLLPWNIAHWPLSPRLWLGEFERTLKQMAVRGLLPYWLKHPRPRNIRNDASESAEGFSDPGNFVLDMVAHALRLWKYCDTNKTERVMKQSIHEYGSRANKSSVGPVNLRGNIVEAMTTNLKDSGSRRKAGGPEVDCEWEWIDRPEQGFSATDWYEGWTSHSSTSQASTWQPSKRHRCW